MTLLQIVNIKRTRIISIGYDKVLSAFVRCIYSTKTFYQHFRLKIFNAVNNSEIFRESKHYIQNVIGENT